MLPRVLISTAGPVAPDDGSIHVLDARQSHHLVRVLRLVDGAPVECFDGAGSRFDARVEHADPKACALRLGARVAVDTESPLRITLAQCISAGERMDWTIEKAVELGVHAIQPLVSARTQARFDEQRLQRRHEHWTRIVESACMQCGRDRLPALAPALGLDRWLGALEPSAPSRRVVLAPQATARLAELRIEPSDSVELLVGPESGLGPEELAGADAAGFSAIRLGPRVLRTETAGIAAIAALQALAGDF